MQEEWKDLSDLKIVEIAPDQPTIRISKAHKRGALFVFEGADGTGKTTVRDACAKYLTQWGYDVEKLREPTRLTPQSDSVMKYIHDPKFDKNDPENRAMLNELYIVDRMYNIEQLIKPALNAGKIILMDRYFHSTAVYGATVNQTMQQILDYNREFLKAPEPVVTFILTQLPVIVKDRLLDRNPNQDRRDPYFDQISQILKDYESLVISDHEGRYVVLHNENYQVTALSAANIISLVSYDGSQHL
jgi:dTMP kinase